MNAPYPEHLYISVSICQPAGSDRPDHELGLSLGPKVTGAVVNQQIPAAKQGVVPRQYVFRRIPDFKINDKTITRLAEASVCHRQQLRDTVDRSKGTLEAIIRGAFQTEIRGPLEAMGFKQQYAEILESINRTSQAKTSTFNQY
jgi:hypothetical protein